MVGSCGIFTNTRQYYVTCAAGVVLDLAGNAMGALNTAGSWQFRTVNVFSDSSPPEVALVSHVEAHLPCVEPLPTGGGQPGAWLRDLHRGAP